jgi:hypothetical protein
MSAYNMTSLKQIEANRFNALKSTGPRTEHGKRRSRSNAVQHGLTAETVIAAFESAEDYRAFEDSIACDYRVGTTIERELVSRLASVLWRLRRSTNIETGMFQVQGELMGEEERRDRGSKSVRSPGWYDEFDVGSPTIANYSAAFGGPDAHSRKPSDSGKRLACCFLRMSRLQFGTFELLTRYETALWRQAAQLALMLHSKMRC